MANSASWVLNKLKRLNEVIWHTPLSGLSKGKIFLIKQSRIFVLASRGFSNDKVQLRASALTFYSLLSIIPVAAIAFAIAKGFGLDQNLQDIITKEFKSMPEISKLLLDTARNALQETSGGYMAGVGIIILFWSVMSLLNNIESSFNHIWQVTYSRTWYRKFTDYLTMMIITPVFLILSSSITVFVGTALPEFLSRAPILDFFKPVISFLVRFTPYLLTWFTLALMFIIMPNAKVKFIPALISGIIIGSILQFLQWLYIDLQFGIYKLSAIYGSFAFFPLFILFLQTSWIIVLLGAELSFANQNIARYEFESEALKISSYQKRALVLMIMHLIIKSFAKGEKPVSAESIKKLLKIPVRLTRDILKDLSEVELVSVIRENEQERLYQPAMDINKLTVSFVFSRLDRKGTGQTMVAKTSEYERVILMLNKFEKLIAKSDYNILIKDL